jgi:hypothetical protein
MMLYFRFLKIVQHDIVVVYTYYVVLFVSSIWPLLTWVVPVFLLEYCIITLRICCLLLNFSLDVLSYDVLSVIWRLHNFKIPFYLVLPNGFSFRAHTFFYLGTTRRFSWNDTSVPHWRFHVNRRMNTSADVSLFKISPFLCLFLCAKGRGR